MENNHLDKSNLNAFTYETYNNLFPTIYVSNHHFKVYMFVF